ncbi:MAG TPA: AIR synthase related protein, partial [Sphingomicrobium sp.]|nr:AIR synthase related protein [Sphingomicrobium sp.]
FKKWELDFAVIGEVTDTGRMELVWNGETIADIPLDPLADEAPLYERPHAIPKPPEPLADIPESTDIAADLLKLMASPALASRRWVWEQYDQSVGADTVQRPGGDAAVVRVHGSKKALAITTDCTPRYCHADPVEGGKQAVAEAYRNLCAVGAKPLAITNCLNFGNPQRPDVMGQFVGCLEGIAAASRALDFPVVSGNVSLYNETKNEDGSNLAILPTPAIGGVGLVADWETSSSIAFKAEAERILLIGADPRSRPEMGQSVWLDVCHGRRDGTPPRVNLPAERRNGDFVRQLVSEGLVTAVHDVSDGGILIAVAEMALAGNVGARLIVETFENQVDREKIQHAWSMFGETQSRFIVTEPHSQHVIEKIAIEQGVGCCFIGWTGGDLIAIDSHQTRSLCEIPLADLRAAHESFFPQLMGSELTPGT